MARAERRSLGILLTHGQGTPEAECAAALARAGARAGAAVRLFLMADGVDLLEQEVDLCGAAVSACSRTVLARGAPTGRPGVDYASQHQLARIVAGCDRFVSL